MAECEKSATWRILSASVCGAAHLRASAPNQDRLGVFEGGSGIILCVADGHGSPKSFRSEYGANFAVEAAISVSQLLVQEIESKSDIWSERDLKQVLPRNVVREWRRNVESHLETNPFTDAEYERLRRHGDSAVTAVETNPILAYGTTLLIVIIIADAVVYVQLGDGDILIVSSGGDVDRPWNDQDTRLFADETTSLCLPNAEQDFRVRFQRLTTNPPAIVLLATDGYAKSYHDDEGFLKVGRDMLSFLREREGVERVEAQLARWLALTSEGGSGDDVTAVIAYRVEEAGAALSPSEGETCEG